MLLVVGSENWGHILYADNLFIFANWASSLLDIQMFLAGLIWANRRSSPVEMKKDLKQFERFVERGPCHYIRDGGILYLQWIDKRTVSLLSTIHLGHKYNLVQQKVKIDGIRFELPCTAESNCSFGRSDVFDQVIATHCVFQKTKSILRALSWIGKMFPISFLSRGEKHTHFCPVKKTFWPCRLLNKPDPSAEWPQWKESTITVSLQTSTICTNSDALVLSNEEKEEWQDLQRGWWKQTLVCDLASDVRCLSSYQEQQKLFSGLPQAPLTSIISWTSIRLDVYIPYHYFCQVKFCSRP